MAWKKNPGAPVVARKNVEIDAANQPVGRLATRIATILVGKNKVSHTPHIDGGDFVTVKNVDQVVFTGRKWEQKVHYRTSNRPGGLKETPVAVLRTKNPAEIVRHAVKYMLPKNRTQDVRMKRLKFV